MSEVKRDYALILDIALVILPLILIVAGIGWTAFAIISDHPTTTYEVVNDCDGLEYDENGNISGYYVDKTYSVPRNVIVGGHVFIAYDVYHYYEHYIGEPPTKTVEHFEFPYDLWLKIIYGMSVALIGFFIFHTLSILGRW